ncbi:MAG: hypothetical protein ACTHMV_12190 [Chitinophagaceae bacterium]
MNEHNCRVCGLYITESPWGMDGESPTYEICPCCGVEFGNEDYTIEATRRYRQKWLDKGGDWFNLKEKPEVWDKEEQMKDIPEEFV